MTTVTESSAPNEGGLQQTLDKLWKLEHAAERALEQMRVLASALIQCSNALNAFREVLPPMEDGDDDGN